ncbi:Sulfate permease [Echinococcus multilocularis]|uniref:Sulfate permease n=1 Tax=Echinococcus multilocularis TaxID=6211 RepID=A0A0S4MM05_ECHMU|nr:Sulfate permease [Echinococcus multilocularis]
MGKKTSLLPKHLLSNEADEHEQCTRLPQSKPPHTDEVGEHPLTADAAPPQEEASNTPTGEKLLSAAITDPSQVELVDLVLKEEHLLNQLTYLFRMPSASQGVLCAGLKPFSVDQFLGLISTNSMTYKRS